MASQVWKVVKPHIPMIKFRKGSAKPGATAASAVRSGSQMQRGASDAATGPGVIVLPTIEDIHLPPRYQRRPLDQREIEYINRGGPE